MSASQPPFPGSLAFKKVDSKDKQCHTSAVRADFHLPITTRQHLARLPLGWIIVPSH